MDRCNRHGKDQWFTRVTPNSRQRPSGLIDARIKELGHWRAKALARVRALIKQADPDVIELFYAMYLEEGRLTDPAQICAFILEQNLHGIDIDERAVQIAALALVMKAKEKAPGFTS